MSPTANNSPNMEYNRPPRDCYHNPSRHQRPQQETARKLKCVFVGDGAVGKTSLIVSYTTNGYPQEYVPTAYDNYSVLVRVDNKPVQLQLCDTAGQDDFDSIRPLAYPDSDVFLLCFSVVNPTSFYNLDQQWLSEIRRIAPNTPIILVGTQADLRRNVRVVMELSRYGETPVTEAEAWEYAREISAQQYIECSALTQHNLKEVFDAAILAALNLNNNNRESRIFLQEVKKSKSLRQLVRDKLRRSNSSEDLSGTTSEGSTFGGSNGAEPARGGAYSQQPQPLTHCNSQVMMKRQMSNGRLNDLRALPPSPVTPPKFGKVKKGWKRFLCAFSR